MLVMKRPWLVPVFLALATLGAAQVDSPLANFIAYKSKAFHVGAPLLIAGPKVVKATWSYDGRYLLVQQIEAEGSVVEARKNVLAEEHVEPTLALSLFSLDTGRLTPLLRFDGSTSITETRWIPDSRRALVTVVQDLGGEEALPNIQTELYSLDAESGAMRSMRLWSTTSVPFQVEVMPSPTQGYVFIRGSFREKTKVGDEPPKETIRYELLLMGASGGTVAIKTSEGLTDGLPVWSTKGDAAYLLQPTHQQEGPRAKWYKISLSNGALTDSERPKEFYMGNNEKPSGLITVREVIDRSVNGQAAMPIRNLWLETTDPDALNRLLLAGDASGAEVSSTMEAASFISNDCLFIRPIVEVPKARYDEAIVLFERSKVLSRAKQAGLGVMMFTADNEDVLPSNKQDLRDLLRPYFPPGFTLDDFTYTYPGGPVSDIKKPATTQIGYIDTSLGTAVVFADGHVEWKPKS